MNLIKAPDPFPSTGYRVFLAGSIEMGAAENWQDRLTGMLADYDLTILNPRRDDWDSSWKQSIEDPQFNQQVTWELDALEAADFIALYFDPSTKSPISLLELGLFTTDNIHVCCPDGFWRKGNVDIVCERYGIQQVPTLDHLYGNIIEGFNGWKGRIY